MKKLVNIDEGHTGSLLNWGQDRRGRGGSGKKMDPTCGFTSSLNVKRICVFVSAVSKC